MLRQISRYAPWFLLASAAATLILSSNGADFYASLAWISALAWSVSRRGEAEEPKYRAESVPAESRAPVVAAGFVGAVVGALWFSPGRFYAFGDRTPLIRDTVASNLFSPWSNAYSGGGNVTWDVTRVAEVLFYKTGVILQDPATGQRIFTAVVFAYTAYSAARLLSRAINSRLLISLGGVIVTLSPLVMVTLPNYLHVIVTGVACASVSHFIDLRRGAAVRWYSLFANTFPVFLVGTNPPLTIIALATVALSPLLSKIFEDTKVGVRRSSKHVAVSLVMNSWWLVPAATAAAVARSSGTTDTALDPSRWAWASSNSSISNLTTGAANWSWPRDEYFGPAVSAASPWFSWALWLIPLLFFMSYTERFNGGRVARRAVAVCVPTLLVAKGLHSPATGLNSWMYENVPGFWLLRQPTTKVWWLLWVLMVVVSLRTLETISLKTKELLSGRLKAGHLLAVVALIPVWPLLTGTSVVSATHDGWPAHRVEVPADWYALGDHMKREIGNVVSLPLADFYMMPTTWGFYGWDNIARNVVDDAVFSLTDESYIGNPPGLSAIVKQYESSLLARDVNALQSIGRDLGVGSVLVRKDYDTSSPIRDVSIKDYRDIERSLSSVGAERTFNGPSVSVWRLPWPVFSSYATKNYVFVSPDLTPEDTALVVASAGKASVIQSDRATGKTEAVVDSQSIVINEPYEITRTGDATVYDILNDGGAVTLTEATDLMLSSGQSAQRRVYKLGSGSGIRVNGVWRAAGSRIGLPLGNTQIEVLSFDENYTQVGGISPLADCNKVDNAPISDTGLYISTQGDYLELGAKYHSACIHWASDLEPGSEYLVELQADHISGRPPRWCIQQYTDGKASCAPLHDVRIEGDTFKASTVITARKQPSIKIFAYADGSPSGDLTTKARYRVPVLRKVTGTVTTDVSVTPIKSKTASGSTSVSLPRAETDVLNFSPPAPCGGKKTIGVSGRETSSGVLLSVFSGTSCMAADVYGLIPGGELSFSSYVSGTPGARVSACILSGDETSCDKTEVELSDGKALLTFAARTPTDSFVNRLYLYVEDGGVESSVEFFDMTIRNVPSESVVGLPLSSYVSDEIVGSDGPVVPVQDSGSYLIHNRTSHGGGWRSDGTHVVSGGWSNGWLVDITKSREIRPVNITSTALQVFLAAYLLAAAVMLVNYLKDRKLDRRIKRESPPDLI